MGSWGHGVMRAGLFCFLCHTVLFLLNSRLPPGRARAGVFNRLDGSLPVPWPIRGGTQTRYHKIFRFFIQSYSKWFFFDQPTPHLSAFPTYSSRDQWRSERRFILCRGVMGAVSDRRSFSRMSARSEPAFISSGWARAGNRSQAACWSKNEQKRLNHSFFSVSLQDTPYFLTLMVSKNPCRYWAVAIFTLLHSYFYIIGYRVDISL